MKKVWRHQAQVIIYHPPKKYEGTQILQYKGLKNGNMHRGLGPIHEFPKSDDRYFHRE